MKTHLQQLRIQHGYKSARAFAEEHGYNVGTYTNLEQGVNKMSIPTAWELADIFHVTLDELVGRDFKPDSAFGSPETRRLVESFESLPREGRASIMEQVELQQLKSASEAQRAVQDNQVSGAA